MDFLSEETVRKTNILRPVAIARERSDAALLAVIRSLPRIEIRTVAK
jgi:hypothetical protein